jgi:hypothetical protein
VDGTYPVWKPGDEWTRLGFKRRRENELHESCQHRPLRTPLGKAEQTLSGECNADSYRGKQSEPLRGHAEQTLSGECKARFHWGKQCGPFRGITLWTPPGKAERSLSGERNVDSVGESRANPFGGTQCRPELGNVERTLSGERNADPAWGTLLVGRWRATLGCTL